MIRSSHTHHGRHNNEEPIDQEEKINEFRLRLGPLSHRSLQYCSNACLRRYLEARNWNVEKSKKMLEETLMWRSTYKPEEIRWHEIAAEGETGKVYKANFQDRDGRTVLVLKPGKQNTSSHVNQLRHLVYLIENAILSLPDDHEQMVWLIDFSGWSLTRAVSMKTTKETVHILQSHYPERLFSAFLYSPPRIFESFWKVVKYFLDPKTFQKVKFVYPKNEESVATMRRSFDPETLPKEFGGHSDAQYDHEEFSRLMAKEDTRTAEFWQ